MDIFHESSMKIHEEFNYPRFSANYPGIISSDTIVSSMVSAKEQLRIAAKQLEANRPMETTGTTGKTCPGRKHWEIDSTASAYVSGFGWFSGAEDKAP